MNITQDNGKDILRFSTAKSKIGDEFSFDIEAFRRDYPDVPSDVIETGKIAHVRNYIRGEDWETDDFGIMGEVKRLRKEANDDQARLKEAAKVAVKGIRAHGLYKDFDALFTDTGETKSDAAATNYPLHGAEAKLAWSYADALAQYGGILRRLGLVEDALALYEKSARIEAREVDLGFENSYGTFNAISLQIETGLARATPSEDGPPDISDQIAAARNLIKDQIQKGERRGDPWAHSDLATLTAMWSELGDDDTVPVDVLKNVLAFNDLTEDIDSTLRVAALLRDKLKEMNDPAGRRLDSMIDYLKENV